MLQSEIFRNKYCDHELVKKISPTVVHLAAMLEQLGVRWLAQGYTDSTLISPAILEIELLNKPTSFSISPVLP